MASVLPHVTVISVSGSTTRPRCQPACSATASRRFFAPQVTAYWLMSSSIARHAASLITRGAAKSGIPCARLIALCLRASTDMPRITLSVNRAAFCEIKGPCIACGYLGGGRKASELFDGPPRARCGARCRRFPAAGTTRIYSRGAQRLTAIGNCLENCFIDLTTEWAGPGCRPTSQTVRYPGPPEPFKSKKKNIPSHRPVAFMARHA